MRGHRVSWRLLAKWRAVCGACFCTCFHCIEVECFPEMTDIWTTQCQATERTSSQGLWDGMKEQTGHACA